MPIDLNTYTIETLAERIRELRPGQSLVSNDGQIVRRRHTSSGYDCGVGRGGNAQRRKNNPEDAARDMMQTSARYQNPNALGGGTSYDNIQDALDSLRRDPNARPGPSPAIAVLRKIIRQTKVSSYRTRAQRALEAVKRGDIAEAVRNLEAVVDHAGTHGRMEEIDRARNAISEVREHHELDKQLAREEVLRQTKIEVRTIGTQHHVFRDGADMTGPLPRQEAEKRRDFLVRKATRAEAVQEIDNEIAGIPNLVRRAGDPQEDAA